MVSLESLLKDEHTSVVADYSSGGSILLMAFGGIKGKLGIPPFEFFNLVSAFKTGKVYVRDLRQAWYHCGLPGIAADINGIARYLVKEKNTQRSDLVVVCGNSMGGYAAILFGWLLNADVIHAFAPQTFISGTKRLFYRDRRWQEQIRRVHRARSTQREFYDLRRVLRSRPSMKSEIHLHFSTINRLDRIHALQLQGIPNVVLHAYEDKEGHGLVRSLRDSGALERILSQSLGL